MIAARSRATPLAFRAIKADPEEKKRLFSGIPAEPRKI
jgi:hypothetical protein